jgi:hypothetical protein
MPIPHWTTRLTDTTVDGEDHLGVEGAAQSYQQALVPGIISTTDHARYYSFYCWVLYRFIQGESRLLKDFRGPYFRRHEVAYLLGCYSHHRERGGLPGIVGAGTNQYKARHFWEAADPVSLDVDYFGNKLGGFGQYYRPVMETMGLVRPPERNKLVYRLTHRGEALAQAFGQSVKRTRYATALAQQGQLSTLSHADAADYGQQACLCAEALGSGTDRSLLLDAFFRFDEAGRKNPHVRRRLTLGLLLDLVDQSGAVPFADGLRPALYLGRFAPDRPYQPAEGLAGIAFRWRMVQIRHSYTAALQALWAVFLDRLRTETDQHFTFDQFMAWAIAHLAPEQAGLPVNAYLDQLCAGVGLSTPWPEAAPHFAAACQAAGGGDELSLYKALLEAGRDPAMLIPHALRILGQLFLRHYELARQNDSAWQELAGQPRLPLSHFFAELTRHLQSPTWTVAEALRWLYRDYLLGQHEIIALQKLRQNEYDTFKFYYRDGNFFWANNPPDFKEPLRLPGLRLTNSLTMLVDLGLVTRDEAGTCRLTDDGRHYLQRVVEAADGD